MRMSRAQACEDDDTTGKHLALFDSGVVFGLYGPPHYDWEFGWCVFTHQMGCCNSPLCVSWDSEDGTDMISVLAHAQGAEPDRLVEKYADSIVYNHSRRSIQVIDCSGRMVVAHIPSSCELRAGNQWDLRYAQPRVPLYGELDVLALHSSGPGTGG